jgi:hypothetical protein
MRASQHAGGRWKDARLPRPDTSRCHAPPDASQRLSTPGRLLAQCSAAAAAAAAAACAQRVHVLLTDLGLTCVRVVCVPPEGPPRGGVPGFWAPEQARRPPTHPPTHTHTHPPTHPHTAATLTTPGAGAPPLRLPFHARAHTHISASLIIVMSGSAAVAAAIAATRDTPCCLPELGRGGTAA